MRRSGFWGSAAAAVEAPSCMSGRRSTPVPAIGAAFVLALFLGLAGQAGPAAAGQEAETPPGVNQLDAGPIIQDVVIRGNQRIEASTVLNYISLRPGTQYSARLADRSLKTLFATGLFRDVRIEPAGNQVIITVDENPIINRISFEGNRAIDDEDLQNEVRLRPRIVYTRTRVEEDLQRIVQLYRRQGRFAARVEPKLVTLPQNRVDLVFEIDEGDVTGVKNIIFLGNEVFSDSDLKGVIVTEESVWWNIFQSNDNYDPDRVAFDREQLRDFYLSEGYADFRVVSAVAELTPTRDAFFLTYTVDEGEQYTFGEVNVESEIEDLPASLLRSAVRIREGETYNAQRIEDAVDSITFIAGTLGYAFVDVAQLPNRREGENILDLTFRVEEGPRVYVERIDIAGNSRTIDKVIRREMRVVEGDAFNRVLLDRSRARIRGLGFFSAVEINEEPGTAADRTIVTVEVEEQSTGELNFGFGFSSVENFVGNFSISERNLLGRGQSLRLALNLSSRRQLIQLSFTDPYFLGRNLLAGANIFRNRTNFEDEAGFVVNSTGAGFSVGFPLAEFRRLTTQYSFRVDEIDALDLALEEGNFTSSIVGYTISEDRRNDVIEPSSGWAVTFSNSVAGLGGDVEYVLGELNAAYYIPLWWDDWVLKIQGSGGGVYDYLQDGVRTNDRFFRGATTFRGFDIAGIGPRIVPTEAGQGLLSRDQALGGRYFGIGSLELRFDLGIPEELGIRTTLFTDFGTVTGIEERDLPEATQQAISDGLLRLEDSAALRMSAGLTVSWNSPFGPLRIDIGQPIAREEFDEIQFINFTGGTNF